VRSLRLFDRAVSHRLKSPAAFAWFVVSLLTSVFASDAAAQVMAGTSIYVRQDTDKTTVIAPRWHVGAPVADRTRVDFVYTADVWTSASIDIRTSASKAVTEQRDEINSTVTQEWEDFSLSATYRYSHEYDYLSHGATLSGSYAMAEKSSTLDFRVNATFDDVGRAGDRNFNRNVRNLGARIGFTQLIDAETFVQGAYELMSAHGFNSSPYRYVGIGSENGLCSGMGTAFCIPEANPSERLRHALVGTLRRALGEQWAFGLSYRFYLDNWNVNSHTARRAQLQPEHHVDVCAALPLLSAGRGQALQAKLLGLRHGAALLQQ
jgi:hypothetical protein